MDMEYWVLTKKEGFSFGYTCDVEPFPATVGNEGLGLQSPNQKYQNIILVGEYRIPRVFKSYTKHLNWILKFLTGMESFTKMASQQFYQKFMFIL